MELWLSWGCDNIFVVVFPIVVVMVVDPESYFESLFKIWSVTAEILLTLSLWLWVCESFSWEPQL